MNRAIFFTFCILVNGSVSFSQMTNTYDYKNFSKIDISSAFEVTIKQSESYSISISIDESMMENLEVSNENGELEIGLKGWKSSSKFRPTATIELPELTELEISGASEVNLDDFSATELQIELSGASSLNGFVNIQKFNMDASGASRCKLKGKANKMEIYLSGASIFDAKELLLTDELIFDASGASSANCNVDGDMYLKLEGASRLSYSGQGDIVKKEVSGASVVDKE